MDDSKVFMFPDAAKSVLDPNLLLALNNNGGFGNNGNWIWILFMWMMWGYGGNGWGNGFGGNNGTGFLANQLNNDAGRDLLLQAINGRADALAQLAQITNSSVETVKNNLFTIQSAIQNVTSLIGMSGLEVQNVIQSGNAAIAQQICQCCCENRLAICNQTNALQQQATANASAAQLQLAQHDSDVRLQLALNEAADLLSVCQLTNTLSNQADRNTNNILSAIQTQNTLITKEFCDLKERELQNKINTQGDIITQLRNQISNDNQTILFNKAISALDDKIDAIAAKQPNTVPITWPNLTAVNNTPNVGYGYGYGYPWGNGFGNNIVF